MAIKWSASHLVTHKDTMAKPSFPSCHTQRHYCQAHIPVFLSHSLRPWIPVSNSSFSVVLEPDSGPHCVGYASLLFPVMLVLSGCRSSISFSSVKKQAQLVFGPAIHIRCQGQGIGFMSLTNPLILSLYK